MKSKKPPAKKPAKTTTYTVYHNTGPFPDAIMPAKTSSRTQPPAKPVKPARVKRPKASDGWSVTTNCVGLNVEWCDHTFSYDTTHIRRVAAWLLHAAAYLDQEARRGKKT